MLHEVLLALLGCPGDVFVDAPAECVSSSSERPAAETAARRPSTPGCDQAEPRLVVAADVPLAGPEREALNRLARGEESL